jgi:hypothetical protein
LIPRPTWPTSSRASSRATPTAAWTDFCRGPITPPQLTWPDNTAYAEVDRFVRAQQILKFSDIIMHVAE